MGYNQKIKDQYNGNYVIGLDIGTGSVGWSVIDENYQIPLYRGKKAFGSRLFSSGETAENRRVQRGMRRRIRRRKNRIRFLQEIFAEEMQQYDAAFFNQIKDLDNMDIKNEQYQSAHTSLSMQKILLSLPKEIGFSKDDFPTMYHLRLRAMSEEKMDLRLIYLALHHIVRRRGHFLHEGLSVESLTKFDKWKFKDLIDIFLQIKEEETHTLEISDIDSMITILMDKDLTRKDREQKIKKIDKRLEKFAKALLDSKFRLDKIFNLDEKKSVHFSQVDFITEVEEVLDTGQLELLNQLNEFFLQLTFTEILGESTTLSDAKIKAYDLYREHLQMLKTLLGGNQDLKREILNSTEKQKAAWENQRKKGDDPRCLVDRYQDNSVNLKEFYKGLKGALESSPLSNELLKNEILDLIDKEQFMIKLNTTRNSELPYQLHLLEAKQIMQQQKKFYPQLFTNENINKIEQIIMFRIPYYVGPLASTKSEKDSDFAWLQKVADEPIRPWNFNQVVDIPKSAENFIQRMVGDCTYLIDEKSLPKQSLYYQLFEVLNELNVVKIDGEPITKSVRDYLLELFFKHKKVSIAQAEKYLQKMFDGSYYKISGISNQTHFNSSLSTWIDMRQILSIDLTIESVLQPSNQFSALLEKIENIILWSTVFPEGDILKKKISSTYGELSEKQIDLLCKLKYSGWGSLSKKLLVELPTRKNTKYANKTILELLYTYITGKNQRLHNFQQIITTSSLGFQDIIDGVNGGHKKTNAIHFDDINQLAGSPAIKRGIWQSILIIEELVKIFGTPRAIVLETAKSEQEKKRTKSRAEIWEQTYRNDADPSIKKEISELSVNFNDDRVWLYLLQNGRCMYTGEKLDINNLSSYEVDHIIPYSLVNDNSIDNRVLVKSQQNQRKGNTLMPLGLMNDVQQKDAMQRWLFLKITGRISEKKYNNLLKKEISSEMAEGFINRQLVETRQITKHVIALLNRRFSNKTNIIGLRAEINDRVKRDIGLVKLRALNDKHHAVDAYMAAFIFNYLSSIQGLSFVDGRISWKKDYKTKNLSLENRRKTYYWIYGNMKEKGLISLNGEILARGEEEIYSYITKEIDDLRVNFTRKVGNTTQEFWDATILPTLEKNTNPFLPKTKLGAFTNENKEEMLLIEYKGKKETVEYAFVDVPIYIYAAEKGKATAILQRLIDEKRVKRKDAKVVKQIEKGTLYKLNGMPFRFTSTKEQTMSFQLQLSQKEQRLFNWKNEKDMDESGKLNALILRQVRALELIREKIDAYYDIYFTEKQSSEILSSIERYIELVRLITSKNIEQSVKALNEGVMKKALIDPRQVEKTRFGIFTIFQKFIQLIFRATGSGAGRVEEWSYAGRITKAIDLKKAESLEIIYESITGLQQKVFKLK